MITNVVVSGDETEGFHMAALPYQISDICSKNCLFAHFKLCILGNHTNKPH